jgi:hypothetical protein
MAERYFGPEEAQKLIPRLASIMDSLMPAYREATEVRERLEAERQRIALAGGGTIDQAAWRADTTRMERLAGAVQRGIADIQALGGAPKDLGLGLVDFLHQRDGREVNLCWKYGENVIRYWHGTDEGYARRKPL